MCSTVLRPYKYQGAESNFTPEQCRQIVIGRVHPRIRNDGECRIWDCQLNRRQPYLSIYCNGFKFNVALRRLVWKATYGNNPRFRVGVCCNEPLCVNPLHLISIEDEKQKHYYTHDEIYKALILLWNTKLPYSEIARQTGIKISVVRRIMKRGKL